MLYDFILILQKTCFQKAFVFFLKNLIYKEKCALATYTLYIFMCRFFFEKPHLQKHVHSQTERV